MKAVKKDTAKDQKDCAEGLYTALKMILASSDNRSAIIAVEVAKRAILKYEGKNVD